MTDEDRNAIRRHTKAGSRLNVVVTDLREQHPEVKKRDILNERAKLERAAAGPYTQTQCFIQALQESAYAVALITGSSGFFGPFHGARRW